jgi:BirA family biotin operon repressor/biotin-[acetyl-CoA-carboxylase] ligase
MDFDGDQLTRLLKGHSIGRRIHFFREVESTNLYAAELARRGAEEGEVVVADCQCRGRGRLDRTWQSPPDKNLYTSVILRPPIPPAVSPQITLTTGVAVAETLSVYAGNAVSLKWPNDVLIHGKKACGILTEMRLKGAEIDFIIVGIGLNVNMRQEDFSESVREAATSLSAELGRDFSRTEVTVKLLNLFEKWYGIFVKEGFSSVRERWMALSGILGREIRVFSKGRVERGRVTGLDEDGALLIFNEERKEKRIIAGDVVLMEG